MVMAGEVRREEMGKEQKGRSEKDRNLTELIYRTKVIEPPYLIRKFGVSEEEYDQFTDEDTKADLFDGTLIIHSPASTRHETIFKFLLFLMYGYAEQKQLGEVLGSRETMHLAHCRKFEPDILFVRKERLEMLKEKELEGAADMVVEIISPWARDYDLREKRHVYHEAGIDEIWFIDDEERKIVVDRREGKKYSTEIKTSGKLDSVVMQGFSVQAEWFWQEILPNPFSCLQEIVTLSHD